MKEHIYTASTSHLQKVLQPCKRQDKPSQHNVNTINCEESKRSKREHILTLNADKNCTRPPNLVVHKTDMKEAPSKEIIQHENRSPSATTPAKALSEWKSTRSSEKENVGMSSMNGFMTTKKRGCGTGDENCDKRTQEKSSPGIINGRRDSTAGKKEGGVKRKALAEVTNVEICSEMEITGKWKCPRKGKPYVGPALKQLRLEQWVHRN